MLMSQLRRLCRLSENYKYMSEKGCTLTTEPPPPAHRWPKGEHSDCSYKQKDASSRFISVQTGYMPQCLLVIGKTPGGGGWP